MSKALFFGSLILFAATHDLTPGKNPGGFGDGYRNLVDIVVFYLPAAVVGLIGWAWTAWAIKNRGDDSI